MPKLLKACHKNAHSYDKSVEKNKQRIYNGTNQIKYDGLIYSIYIQLLQVNNEAIQRQNDPCFHWSQEIPKTKLSHQISMMSIKG